LVVLQALCGALGLALFTAALAAEHPPTITVAQLPPEARATLVLIRAHGPFPYERDGVVFGNFERRLPIRERGYYREYTVPTPGLSHRGARRIVAGRNGELYYTSDHYRSFRRIVE
jgi:ribonuclease T1